MKKMKTITKFILLFTLGALIYAYAFIVVQRQWQPTLQKTIIQPRHHTEIIKYRKHTDFNDEELTEYVKNKQSFTDSSKIHPKKYRNLIYNVSCPLLIKGDPHEIIKVQKSLLDKPYKSDDSILLKMLGDCGTFKKEMGYNMHLNSEEEKAFPIAYSIKIHKSALQFEQLLHTIYRPQNMYCIYMDKKSDRQFQKIIQGITKCFPNVFIASKLDVFVYTSFSYVKAELACMRDLIQDRVKWKYYINLTGQEMPLKTNQEIVRILKFLNGANDIESYVQPLIKYRYETRWTVKNNKFVNTYMKKDPFQPEIPIYKGSTFGLFSRPFVYFALNDPLAINFTGWVKNTQSSEEIVWATLVRLPNAPGRMDSDRMRQIAKSVIWRDKIRDHNCTGKFVRNVCVFSSGDIHWLLSRDELFANKFYINMDPIASDCIEEYLLMRESTNEHIR